MPSSTLYHHVEIQCKTFCKTRCIFTAKLCVKTPHAITPCVNPPLSHFFPSNNSHTFPQATTPGVQLTFPLFHLAYYYNY